MYLVPITSQHLHILNQSQRLGYVSGTNQIAVLGYISRTVILQQKDILDQWQRLEIVFLQISHGIRGLHTKNHKKLQFLGSIISLMVCGLCESLEIYLIICIICVIFKLKRVIPLLYSQLTRPLNNLLHQVHTIKTKYIRTYLITTLYEHKAIFHVLELYSINQIPLCQIGLRSITCHFLLNNLHLIMYSNSILQPHWKKNHVESNSTDSEFFSLFSYILNIWHRGILFLLRCI